MIDIKVGIKIAEKFMKKHFAISEMMFASVMKNNYIIIFDVGILHSELKLVSIDIETQKIIGLQS